MLLNEPEVLISIIVALIGLIVLIGLGAYRKIMQDTIKTQEYLLEAIDKKIYHYYATIVTHRDDIVGIEKYYDVFGEGIMNFITGSHRTTADFATLYSALQEDVLYLDALLKKTNISITDEDIEEIFVLLWKLGKRSRARKWIILIFSGGLGWFLLGGLHDPVVYRNGAFTKI